MSQEEYNYNLTIPLDDLEKALQLLDEAKAANPGMRISRKPDTRTSARFYLSFPFKGTRTDLNFKDWITGHLADDWDLYGPNYGVWGLS
ncbi:hypothetical protein [Desulfopila sp. IMCC35008]|uniref:hypothetical protein n=1 Tax=Desulfopila sp. IMCC35008 TaxID=2653858 RepID=UPI0013D41966|nr:hypothetical protein [Desulfopila sp. IMCC35008]